MGRKESPADQGEVQQWEVVSRTSRKHSFGFHRIHLDLKASTTAGKRFNKNDLIRSLETAIWKMSYLNDQVVCSI